VSFEQSRSVTEGTAAPPRPTHQTVPEPAGARPEAAQPSAVPASGETDQPRRVRIRQPEESADASALAQRAFDAVASGVVAGCAYYLGWVHTRAFYNYFGIDHRLLGLSARDYLLYGSVTPVFRPLAAVAFLGLLVLGLRSLFRRSTRKTRWWRRQPMTVLLCILVGVLTMAGLSVYAERTGKAMAGALSKDLGRMPGAVVYSKACLQIAVEGVTEERLPGGKPTYACRYMGLRQLAVGGDSYILVSDMWAPGDHTIALPRGKDLRLEYISPDGTP
jgi:hypothetical protein